MSTLAVSNTFTANTTIFSSEVNQNFSDILSWANGNISDDNFTTMTGEIAWSVATNELAIDIANAGTEGSISIAQSGVLASSKSALKVLGSGTQNAGSALVDFSFTGSATISLAKFTNSGTGNGIDASQSGVLASGKSALSLSVSAAQTTGKAAAFVELTNASSSIPLIKGESAGTGDLVKLGTSSADMFAVGSTGTLKFAGSLTPGWTSNIGFEAAQTSVANDSVRLTSADGSDLSATNPGYICLPSTVTAGALVVFRVTANITIQLTGAHWGMDTHGDQTDVPLHLLAINDNGTLRFGVSFFNRKKIVNTATSATATDINLTSEVLVNSALASGTWPCISLASVECDFDDTGGSSENLWAVGTAVSDYTWLPEGYSTKFMSFTPSVNFDSQTTTGLWARDGKWLTVIGKMAMTGAVSTNNLTHTLPFSLEMISSTVFGDLNNFAMDGMTGFNDGGATFYKGSGMAYLSTTTIGSIVNDAAATILRDSNLTQASPATPANGDEIFFRYRVPISGWEA